MKRTYLLAIAALAAASWLLPCSAAAQTYTTEHTRSLIFPGSGTDLTHLLTIQAPSLTGSPTLTLPGATLTFPATNAAGVLTNPGTGILTWSTLGVGNIAPGGINTFLTTNNLGVVGWNALNVDGVTLTGDGSSAPLAIKSSYVGQTSITTLGTITTGTWNGSIIDLAHGGTNANLTASNGGIFYSTGSAGAILSGTATANQILMSGSNAAPAWSTATYPATTTASSLLYSNGANTVAALGTLNNGMLVTSNTGVPSISSTLPSGLTIPSPAISNPTFSGTVTLPSGSVSTSSIAHGAANTFLTTANDGTTVAFTSINTSSDFSGNGIGSALSIATGAGNDILTALKNASTTGNLALSSSTNATEAAITNSNTGGTTVGLNITANTSNAGKANDGLTFAVANAGAGGTAKDIVGSGNTWSVTSAGAATFAGLTEAGGTANISTTDASAVNVGTGSFTNVIDIGNGTGVSGTFSTTNFAGLINITGKTVFTGPVTLPLGSVSAGSIGLANQNIFVGNSSADAAAVPPVANSVLITDATAPIGTPKWATTLPTGLVLGGETINGASTIGGTTTINTSGAIATSGAMTASGGLTTYGGTANINSTGTNNTNINATPATGGTITIGNSTSTTNFVGTVSFQAGSITGEIFKAKTGDVVLTARSTALQVDPDLQLALPAAGTYEFSGVIAYDASVGGAGGAGSDLKLAMYYTGTATTLRWFANQGGTAVSPSSVSGNAGTALTAVAISDFHVDPTSTTNTQSVFISGIVTVTGAATLEVEEAQNTSQAATTTVRANSFIRATRVQ